MPQASKSRVAPAMPEGSRSLKGVAGPATTGKRTGRRKRKSSTSTCNEDGSDWGGVNGDNAEALAEGRTFQRTFYQKWKYHILAYSCFLLYFGVGAIFFVLGVKRMNFSEYVYFMVTTMTTVGYGDQGPKVSEARELWFTLFWAPVGVIIYVWLMSLSVSELAQTSEAAKQARDEKKHQLIEAQKRRTQETHRRLRKVTRALTHKTADELEELETEEKKKQVAARYATRGFGKGGTAKASQYRKRSSAVGVIQTFSKRTGLKLSNLWMLSQVLLLFIIGVCVMVLKNDYSFTEALYFCVITATTIGYGDISPAKTAASNAAANGTFYDSGCWFAVFFLLYSIYALGLVLGAISDRLEDGRQQHDLEQALGKLKLDKEFLNYMDKDDDNDVSKAEWTVACLEFMELVDPALVSIIEERFDDLDINFDGVLTSVDMKFGLVRAGLVQKAEAECKAKGIDPVEEMTKKPAESEIVHKLQEAVDAELIKLFDVEHGADMNASTLERKYEIKQLQDKIDNESRKLNCLKAKLDKLEGSAGGPGSEVTVRAAAVLPQHSSESAA